MTTPITEPDLNETVELALEEGRGDFLRFLVRRTASLEDAEDILQDFYVKVVQNAQTIRTRGSLRSWLAQVLRHMLADYYRKSAVKQRAQQRLEIATKVAISNDEAEDTVCACLYRLLPSLPPQYAEVIRRIDLLGQPRSQFAKNMRISANNMAVRIYRARRALRVALEKFCVTCPTLGFLNCGCEEAK
jgi:RNA polymerase sigma factor (sigma-70 family)